MTDMADKLKKIAQPDTEIKVPTRKRKPKKVDNTFGEKLVQSAQEAVEIAKPKAPRKRASPKKKAVKQARRACPRIAREFLGGISTYAMMTHVMQAEDLARLRAA